MSQAESSQLVATAPTELEVTIKEFMFVLRGKRRVKDTIQRYRRHLTMWREWMAQRGVSDFDGMTTLQLREWSAEIQERPEWSAATAKFCVSVVHSFLSWCKQEERISRRLADALSIPSVKTEAQRTLTEDEIQLMLASCDDSLEGIRNTALIAMLYDTGFRASEICRLEISGLHFDEVIRGQRVNYGVVVTKGGATLPGYFEAEARAYLERWLQVRPIIPDVNAVFLSFDGDTPGKALTRFKLRDIIAEIGERCGVIGGLLLMPSVEPLRAP